MKISGDILRQDLNFEKGNPLSDYDATSDKFPVNGFQYIVKCVSHAIGIEGMRSVAMQHALWSKTFGHITNEDAESIVHIQDYFNPDFAAIAVRCNPITDFYTKKNLYNDSLIIVGKDHNNILGRELADLERAPIDRNYIYHFNVTTDPAKVSGVNTAGIAHIKAGTWRAYERGMHKGTRRCLREVRRIHLLRTDKAGNITMPLHIYNGYCNVHNSVTWGKPSAGCVVLQPSQKAFGVIVQSRDENYQLYKALLEQAESVPIRTLQMIHFDQFVEYVSKVLHANVVNDAAKSRAQMYLSYLNGYDYVSYMNKAA